MCIEHPDSMLASFRRAFHQACLITAFCLSASGLAQAEPAAPPTPAVPIYGYKVVKVYPHDRTAFTQGLIFHDGRLYESTGINGQSSLREVTLETGKPVRNLPLDEKYFGEGLTVWEDKLVQLTWKAGKGFVYARDSFKKLGDFDYPGEGWGLTHDGSRLIMSDGTPHLRFLDPKTFKEIRKLAVKVGDKPLPTLNELEYIDGEIYANLYGTQAIARISPDTGQVLGLIDLRGLLTQEDLKQPVNVLNGIAYDEASDRLFVTGKLWPKLFEIKLVRRK